MKEKLDHRRLVRLRFGNTNPWVFIQSPIGKNRSTGQVTEISVSDWESSEFVPRTKLGMKLLKIRKNAIAEGVELLGDDEVLEEIRRRRGEF